MAQTGFTPILIYSSSTIGQAPAVGNLTNSTLGSELAINIADGKLFYKDSANAVQVIGWKTVPTSAGGTGLTSYAAGDLIYYASGTTFTKLTIGTSGQWLGSSGTAPQWNSPAALTKTDDTNVTLTLGGSASTALLNAASLTLGWTGQLAASRGGTGTGTYAVGDLLYASGTTTLTKLTIGTAYQALQVNAGGTAPSWQASATSVLTGQGDLLYASAANTLARLAKSTTATRYLANTGSSNNPQWDQVNLTNGVTGTLPVGNGGTGTATAFTAGSVIFAGASGVYTQDNAQFFWDDTNNRLGVGLTSPAQSIDTTGTVKANAFLLDANYQTNYDVKLVTTRGDGGTNTIQVYWNNTYGAAAAGGCLGAYDRTGTYIAPGTTVASSDQYTIYGFIGVAS